MKALLALLLSLSLGATTALAQAEAPIEFEDPASEARFQALTEELRCLVCQNQTLADSDAPLAQDLRHEIHGMIEAGQSDAEIKEFMVARYGDFVLYRPPVQSNTLVLWAAPAVLLLLGALVIGRAVRRRAAQFEAQDTGAPEDES